MHILPLIQVDATNRALVGDKAYSLACLSQGKFPVPEGYVITSDAFNNFIQHGGIHVALRTELAKIDLADLHSVDFASRQLQALVDHTEMPMDMQTEILQQFTHINAEFVAVRSSALWQDGGALWASELPSFLHVPADRLLDEVKRCWKALFSTRSLYYLVKESKNPAEVSMGVIVQKTIDAVASGRVYTRHPVTLDENQMVIEATYGFMEMDGGQKPPFDTYVVQKQPFQILDAHISVQETKFVPAKEAGLQMSETGKQGSKQKLNEAQIKQLTALGIEVEQSCGQDTEMEWVFSDMFYVVQTRKRELG